MERNINILLRPMLDLPSPHHKTSGAYYTPSAVVRALVAWAVRGDGDRLLDPSCGDGRFLALHPSAVGVEQDPVAAALAVDRAPHALVHQGDFFAWAAETPERFEALAGNPPFIRYQKFNGVTRARALDLCRRLGVAFTGLASSWAPFLAAASSLLKPGGRMAFVVPAEIGHAPYAAPLLEHLVSCFDVVQVVAVRDKLFPELSEDCWLLYAEGHGGRTDHIRFTAVDAFDPRERPPAQCRKVPLAEWRLLWDRRLRPYILDDEGRGTYAELAARCSALRLGDVASVGIGYVSGGNDFFHLSPSEAKRWDIPPALLQASVRKGSALPQTALTARSIAEWTARDDAFLLLKLSKEMKLPRAVLRYLDTEAGRVAREAYKCRVRDPWYAVPDVQAPDYFLTYMSGVQPSLVRNEAGATCTNSVHAVRLKPGVKAAQLAAWGSPVVALSCEIQGHPLGGGMLKLEPREAGRILLPGPEAVLAADPRVVARSIETMRRWRHNALAA
jgi:adenine-specific DNA-methyltransferase